MVTLDGLTLQGLGPVAPGSAYWGLLHIEGAATHVTMRKVRHEPEGCTGVFTASWLARPPSHQA
jgi:hypothetical protein